MDSKIKPKPQSSIATAHFDM